MIARRPSLPIMCRPPGLFSVVDDEGMCLVQGRPRVAVSRVEAAADEGKSPAERKNFAEQTLRFQRSDFRCMRLGCYGAENASQCQHYSNSSHRAVLHDLHFLRFRLCSSQLGRQSAVCTIDNRPGAYGYSAIPEPKKFQSEIRFTTSARIYSCVAIN